jgi:hypothetical protein
VDSAGDPIVVDDSERMPEPCAGAGFWIDFDRQLLGDRCPDTGFPSRRAVDYLLDEMGILDEIDRDVARQMLERIAIGRNEARNEDIKPEKPLKNA